MAALAPAPSPHPDPEAAARVRDAGLARGIGLFGLAAGIVNLVVGTAIFTLPSVISARAGGFAPLIYLVAALIMAGVTLCLAEAGSRVPTSGGPYGAIEAAFGPRLGFVAGFMLLLSNMLADGGIAAALASLAGLTGDGRLVARLGFFTLLYGALVIANSLGVRATARLVAAGTLIKLLPLLVFIVIALPHVLHPAPPGPPHPVTLHAFGRALIIALFAFEGVETALGASGEVRDPARTLPLGLFLGMGSVLMLYLLVQLGASALLGGALAASAAPLADASARISPIAHALLLVGGALSMSVWMAGDVLGSSRLIFALARDGALPRPLARVSPTRNVPDRAVLAYAGLCFALAATGSFVELILLSSLAVTVLYALVCLAALRLRRRGIALAGQPRRLPLLPLGAAIGLAGMALMVAAARPAELAGLVVALALGLGGYQLAARRRQPPPATPAGARYFLSAELTPQDHRQGKSTPPPGTSSRPE